MITQRYLERDGDRLLLRLGIGESAAVDILTTAEAMAEARTLLGAAVDGPRAEYRLGSFGEFDITISSDGQAVWIAVDGPDLDSPFRGGQAIVFSVGVAEMVEALRDGE